MSDQYDRLRHEDDDEETPDRVFLVTIGTDMQSVQGRAEAVAMAKEISREQDRRVQVERDDGRVLMHFTGGSLDSFVWETRAGK